MKKILKFSIGIIACIILILYLSTPFVIIKEEEYYLAEYLKYIFDNISLTFKNTSFTQVDMLYNAVVWLVMLVVVATPIGCLIIIGLRGILSGVFTKKNLRLITIELLSFSFSGFLIIISYYLLNKYSLTSYANHLQIAIVSIACSHVWQPILYISAFGSLLMCGLNIYANAIKKKEKKQEENEEK